MVFGLTASIIHFTVLFWCTSERGIIEILCIYANLKVTLVFLEP